ncbi:hypothetical protein ILUMI_02515, partial [Ignelater luminosus]
MEGLLRRYYKISEKVWLNAIMESEDADSIGAESNTLECSYVELSPKPGCTDLTISQSNVSEKVYEWDREKAQMQDKVLRVLTYKYYDCDLMLVHSNESYLHETASAFCLDEEEMETLHLQEFVDFLIVPIEVEVKRTYLPVLERSEIVRVDEDNS